MSDKVFKTWGGWYFWAEVDKYGPYDTKLIATEERRKYYVDLDLRV